MTIFIASDHGGFEMKNKLIEYLQNKNIRIVDMGNYEFNPVDDYPDYVQKLAHTMLQKPEESFGVVICRSGVGASIAANRYKGIRCALGYNEKQVQHAREDDNVNVLALGADFTDFDTAIKLIESFLSAQPKTEEKYARRIKKLDL